MDQHIKADIKRVFELQEKKSKKRCVLQQPGSAEKSFSAF